MIHFFLDLVNMVEELQLLLVIDFFVELLLVVVHMIVIVLMVVETVVLAIEIPLELPVVLVIPLELPVVLVVTDFYFLRSVNRRYLDLLFFVHILEHHLSILSSRATKLKLKFSYSLSCDCSGWVEFCEVASNQHNPSRRT